MSSSHSEPGEKRYKVLITDDEDGIRRSLQFLLHAKGYEPKSYTSASALLADAAALSADCMIADYNMPDLDGLSLLTAIRAKGWNGPAILITAYCTEELKRRAKACGYAQVIPKPFIRGPILEALHRLCACAEVGDCAEPGDQGPDCGC
jgi:FixJ family two-component response regulator